MTLGLQYRRCSLPPMTGSNKAAIVGAHVHVAIVFHDRDKGLLDRRLGGAPDPQSTLSHNPNLYSIIQVKLVALARSVASVHRNLQNVWEGGQVRRTSPPYS